MDLKKAIILSAMVTAGTTVFAQSSNLKKAASNIQKYEELRSTGSAQLGTSFLKTAKEAIDAASVHEKTKDLAETWTYYSLVYASLAVDEKSEENATKAAEAIAKAKELDKDNKNASNLGVAEQNLYSFNFNHGVGFWDKKEYQAAYDSFSKALNYMPGDTTLTYYAGLAAIQNNDYKNGIDKYKQLIDKKDYSQHKAVMVDLPKLYLSLKDTTSALEYAALAAKAYPNENDAVVQNIELNLIVGNEAKIISEIENQISKDGNNKNLYYYLGIAHSANNDTDKAYAAYTKAVQIDPNYNDANLNAGVVLMNGIREKLQKVNEDKSLSNNQFTAKINELKEQIKPAEAHFLKVVENDPKNESALKGLKGLYDFLQQEDKGKAIQAKIDAL
ncbi:tetratricopeptide repeat protein [Sphingobacterium yanglingense]|uniref:Tetratricopeptide repeat protein n=1 Tax=Sphingobacterium yanglingense TaxID=1437280 RepID=A0A4R6WE86_9SPHI|nr:tetratricopeptide repeat protein [Sphingobacterium yanglingense]TDQ78053.1 tetratricopeptide repeat protein [Sphingobacterium yanglingense]